MTEKDYELVAKTINEVRKITNMNQNTIDWVKDRLIHNFRKNDSKFKEYDFENLCDFEMQSEYV